MFDFVHICLNFVVVIDNLFICWTFLLFDNSMVVVVIQVIMLDIVKEAIKVAIGMHQRLIIGPYDSHVVTCQVWPLVVFEFVNEHF